MGHFFTIRNGYVMNYKMIKRTLFSGVAMSLLMSFSSNSASIKDATFGTMFVSEITSIYDGDTFRANIGDVHPIIGERIGVRVAGIDTPEIRGKCEKEKQLARKAKQVTVDFLRGANLVELRNTKRGKYFRIVAEVYGDDRSLADELIKSGLAVKYDGGKKYKNWCE